MPGTLVSDALAPVLFSDATTPAGEWDAAETVTGPWVEVPLPAEVSVECVVGTVTGADTVLSIEVQGADDDSGNGLVSYGKFDDIVDGSDDEIRYLQARVYKPYVRAVGVATGSAVSADVTVTVRPPHYKRDADRTA